MFLRRQIEELQFQLHSKSNLLKKVCHLSSISVFRLTLACINARTRPFLQAKQDIRRYKEQIKAIDVSGKDTHEDEACPALCGNILIG